MKKLNVRLSIVGFIKAGQLVATWFLFYRFMDILLYGKSLWVEPNMAILVFEIILSASWFIGSLFDTAQTVISAQKKG